jgi:cell division protein ZapA
MKRSVTLSIAGQKLALRTDADEAYLRRLAEFVDGRIRDLAATKGGIASHDVALLAALQIADEMFRAKSGNDELRKRVRERSRALKEALARET